MCRDRQIYAFDSLETLIVEHGGRESDRELTKVLKTKHKIKAIGMRHRVWRTHNAFSSSFVFSVSGHHNASKQILVRPYCFDIEFVVV